MKQLPAALFLNHPPVAPHLPADVRLGPYCGALLSSLRELVLRGAALELSTPAVFADMASLRRLDLEGCTAARTGSWLSRVLAAAPDVLALPPGLTQLRAMSSNVFDKCALALGACAGLQRLELSSGVQLPATLKQAPGGVPLGLHIAEEAQVGRVCGCEGVPGCIWPGGRQTGLVAGQGQAARSNAIQYESPWTPFGLDSNCSTDMHTNSCRSSLPAPLPQAITRQGRDSVSVKACLVGRLADMRRLSGWGLGRAALGVLSQMPELRRLCLLGGERRRLELELEVPQLETLRIEGYQIAKVGSCWVWEGDRGGWRGSALLACTLCSH